MSTPIDWIEKFTKLDALWIHDNNPSHPHVLLTSGKHSSGYFNATRVVEQPEILRIACSALSELMRKQLKSSLPQVVVGSAFGAITISHECAKSLNTKMAYTQKTGTNKMTLSRFSIEVGEKVLVVEDVINTGGSTLKTIAELEKLGAEILPMIGALVNRSGKDTLHGRKIISLIEHEMPTWEPYDCPLCKKGSEALRPKEHWAELTNPS